MVRGLLLFERLSSWLLISVTSPADDSFYDLPENLESIRPGEVLRDERALAQFPANSSGRNRLPAGRDSAKRFQRNVGH